MAHGAVCDTHGLIQGSDSAKPFVPFSGSPACVSEAASPWDGNQLAGTPNAILPIAQVLSAVPYRVVMNAVPEMQETGAVFVGAECRASIRTAKCFRIILGCL